jgi:methylglyoxal synthase
MEKKKRIALVAHDNRKKDLLEWVGWNRDNHLICTGTTGKLVENLLNNEQTDRRSDIITIKN